MVAGIIERADDVQTDDHRVLLWDATWADYQRLLEQRGEGSVPRISFLDRPTASAAMREYRAAHEAD